MKNKRKTKQEKGIALSYVLNNKKTSAGITLIALVVTIVVLLILAAVTLNLVIGNNGIITRAKDAKNATAQGLTNDQIGMNSLYDELIELETGGVVNWEETLADANANPDKYKHPGQSSTNGDIGIGTDGKPVNLDLWKYMKINGNEIKLSTSDGCGGEPGYDNSNIVDGKIIGKVPQYIKKDGDSGFFPVTSMMVTFRGCESLTIAPEIPSSVTDMARAFYGCTSLTTAPTIPTSVKYMNSTFSGCTNLTTAPTIPSSVTDMGYTFSDCTSLTTAPTIPSSVTDMGYTFSDCTSLTTAPTIPSSVTDMDSTFSGCTSLTTAPEIPSSVPDMWGTFKECTSLTTAPTIPSSVTNMGYTFSGCTSLTTAPTIPTSVKYMNSTFSGCTNLTTAPTISSSVTKMERTFEGCTSLTTAPTIPSSVTDMKRTFRDCTTLQGTIEINANPTGTSWGDLKNYDKCFENAATEGPGLVVTGSSTMLDEIIATKSETSNIRKGE